MTEPIPRQPIGQPGGTPGRPLGSPSPHVLVVGATSAIAQALCRRLAARGWALTLTGREADSLFPVAADLRVRGAAFVATQALDPCRFEALTAAFATAVAAGGELDGVIVCHGSLTDEQGRFLAPDETRRIIDVNFTSAAAIMAVAAERLAARRSGFLCGISSVAGDRGRQSNFTYGAAKAGFTAYLSGLRNRLHPLGIAVITVEPGIVRTPMTAGLPAADSPLAATPDVVAADIERAILRRRDVVYTPWFWRWIMTVIWSIPEPIFKRLKL